MKDKQYLISEKEYWITPPDVYKKLDDEFHFDYDPCPYPFNRVDGTETEWGERTYLNPPFRKLDGKCGKSPIDFIKKAIEENKKGKTIVILRNTNSFINMLIEAGAEVRSLGRVKWLDGKTREPWKSPSNTTCFILRGKKAKSKKPVDTLNRDNVEKIMNKGLENPEIDKVIYYPEDREDAIDQILSLVPPPISEDKIREILNNLLDSSGVEVVSPNEYTSSSYLKSKYPNWKKVIKARDKTIKELSQLYLQPEIDRNGFRLNSPEMIKKRKELKELRAKQGEDKNDKT